MNMKQTIYPDGEDAFCEAALEGNLTQQPVSGLTGFVSKTGKVSESLTFIDYYPVISSPITEYKAVHKCLRYVECATQEVQQKYTIITFDLGYA